MRAFGDTAERERALAAVADIQYGVVSTQQLRKLGFSASAIGRRRAAGRLRRVHHGVHAVGHAHLRPEGRWMAAVLACGPGAALSHRDAAALWDLRRTGSRPYVEVTVPGGGGRGRRAGIRVHRSITLAADHVVEHRGIPVTTPGRTLDDLRRVLPPHLVRRAREQAELQGLITRDPHAPPATRSDLEAAFLLLCEDFGIPAPAVNVAVGPYTVDFLWPRERVVVETDHHFTHGTKTAFDDDRERGVWLEAAGHHLVRCSDAQILGRPELVAAAVRRALRAGRGA